MSNNNTFWWAALVAWMIGATWWHTCKVKQLCDAPLLSAVTTTPVETSEVPPLQISDGSGLTLISAGNFGFAKSGSQPNFSAVRSEIDSLSAYLKANPNKKIVITGYYSSGETNNSEWPDLGIARAEEIKKYYVNNGLPANMFSTKGELQEDIRFSPDSMSGGIGFAFSEVAPEAKLADEQKFEGVLKPLDLYFNTGSMEYIKTADNQKFVEEAKKYLAANKDKKLVLTGHTDNVGNKAANEILSEKRAGQAKRQLIAAGLSESQLATDAKGQSSPKASNETAEGKAANRRVSIVIQ